MAENKLTEIIQASLEQIKQVVDANTIIGTPITTPNGTTIIPVSKVMVGFASGGLDYLGKNMARKAQNSPQNSGLTTNFGGGGGTGVTVQPVGFLVVGALYPDQTDYANNMAELIVCVLTVVSIIFAFYEFVRRK